MNRMVYNVVIIEPSEILQRGLSDIFNQSYLFNVSDTCADLSTYLSLPISRQNADIFIINPSLVSHSKYETSIKSLFPSSKVVALLYNYISKDLMSQFDDYVELYDKSSKIYHKLEQIATTDSVVQVKTDTSGELSEREREILIVVAKGMQHQEIASLYHISIHTVMAHRKNISRTTGIKSV